MTMVGKSVVLVVFLCLIWPNENWAQNQSDLQTANGRIPQQGNVDSDSVISVVKSPKGAMLRSLFVPGWGQLYNGKWFKAIIVFGVEAGLAGNAVYQNQLAVQAVTKLDREWYQDNRNLSVWWLLGTVLLSMADAYVDAHLYNFDESPDLSWDVRSITETIGNSPVIGLSLTVKM